VKVGGVQASNFNGEESRLTRDDAFGISGLVETELLEEIDMHRMAVGFLVLLSVGALLFIAPQIQSQPPDRQTERDSRPQVGQRGGERGPEGRGRGRRGFRMLAPPLLRAIDADGDGEISAEELKNASAALNELDKDDDGAIADRELMPDLGGGGFPFPGG
jgi:hypothetical protein